ncbi:MAG: hypothetical protein LBQ40_02840 [Clostridiales bacterium]|jgi:hypothetical protein|nr:hypothetical protein [Clostridiales bacterium]
MQYYRTIFCDKTVRNPLICSETNLVELRIWDKWHLARKIFSIGKPFEAIDKKIIFRSADEADDGEPDDVLQNSDMVPIFSRRLVRALNEAGIEDIQYIPIDVYTSKNELLEGFCIANVLKLVDNAFNYEHSVYERYSINDERVSFRGKMKTPLKYVLNQKAIDGLDVFKLAPTEETFNGTWHFFVSERFKNVFTKNKFHGFSFHLIETV